jgi:hypothetical protein
MENNNAVIKEGVMSTGNVNSLIENDDRLNQDNFLDVFKIDYFEFESVLKQVLTRNLEKQFKHLYDKLNDAEKNYFEIKNLNTLTWVFNVNSVYSYRGDMSTSSLQKFFHMIFKDYDGDTNLDIEPEEKFRSLKLVDSSNNGISLLPNKKNFDLDPKSEFLKFKSSFVELFNSTFLMTLNGDNLILDEYNLNEWISKVEFKNGFLNFFLKGRAKELADSQKKKNEKTTKWSKHEENGYLVRKYLIKIIFLLI